jgi:hypothetical protein
MKTFAFSAAALALAGCASLASAAPPAQRPTPSALLATWDVALQFDEAAAPSKTEMVFTAIQDGACTGAFYGTPMQLCRAIVRGDAVIFAAISADQSGLYFHSGRLGADGVIVGQTLSQGRNFLMNWTAKKS